MKYGLFIALTFALIFGAYKAAQTEMSRPLNISSLKLGMTVDQLEEVFGTPSAEGRNQLTYILSDGSELYITLRDKLVSSANIKFHHPIKIQDPDMRQLTMVQMDNYSSNSNEQSWFFAGRPSEGLIYKISNKGIIEGITWVPPFTYSNNKPKHLQALYRDFQIQQITNL